MDHTSPQTLSRRGVRVADEERGRMLADADAVRVGHGPIDEQAHHLAHSPRILSRPSPRSASSRRRRTRVEQQPVLSEPSSRHPLHVSPLGTPPVRSSPVAPGTVCRAMVASAVAVCAYSIRALSIAGRELRSEHSQAFDEARFGARENQAGGDRHHAVVGGFEGSHERGVRRGTRRGQTRGIRAREGQCERRRGRCRVGEGVPVCRRTTR